MARHVKAIDPLLEEWPPTLSATDASETHALVAHHQWSTHEHAALVAAFFAAMRATFLARWNEVGFLGTPPPRAALARVRQEAETSAASVVKTHNAALHRFIADFVARYVAQHQGQRTGLASALQTALRAWIDQRASWKPNDVASYLTRLALSLADLYAGGSAARYTVDGPPLSATSCSPCTSVYGKVLTPQQAWTLIAPLHLNCEHYLRLLDAGELERYTATGRF